MDTTILALTSSGTDWRWGEDWYDSLGDGYKWSYQAGADWQREFAKPAPMPDLSGVTMIGGFREGAIVLR